ncbi:STAS domain-containing protein [Thiomicrorhabdus sp. Kp2]|uniref:STAS domain-containing protein n=1 Tax=Thiomicrorhabdus sp. Kp2 TaxID=1123518 RepID=UPI0003FE3D89|nr:STAS domain-containing protein [Thiomicrorhabdus sp. Kp2]
MSNIIQLPENLTIHHIEGHFNELNKKFNDMGDEITFQASAVETIDTSGLQTLLVLVKAAVENGKKVVWQDVPETLKLNAEKLGIASELSL